MALFVRLDTVLLRLLFICSSVLLLGGMRSLVLLWWFLLLFLYHLDVSARFILILTTGFLGVLGLSVPVSWPLLLLISHIALIGGKS